MTRLTINLTIPIYSERLIGTPDLTFSHWLPTGKEQGIFVTDGATQIVLWFDRTCLAFVHDPDNESDIARYSNVLVDKVKATITVDEIPEDTATYMVDRKNNRAPYDHEERVHADYETLGKQIYHSLLTRVNRLIAYARVVKGQFWLLAHEINPDQAHSFWTRCDAKGKFDHSEYFWFLPGSGNRFTITRQSEKRYISQTEWPTAIQYVQGNGKSPFVSELLSGAERLAGNGYLRSALTEAVAALEVAVSTFAKSSSGNEKLSSMFGSRIGIAQLGKQIERLGFTNTVSYLLPLIIPEEVLPADILESCRNAITARQNVIHNGQRDVPNVHTYIRSIRRCCEILDDFGNTGHFLAKLT